MTNRQHKKAYDNLIQVGDIVYVKIYVRQELYYKLGVRFVGPYTVVEKINKNKYKLENVSNIDDVRDVPLMQIKKPKVLPETKVKKYVVSFLGTTFLFLFFSDLRYFV